MSSEVSMSLRERLATHGEDRVAVAFPGGLWEGTARDALRNFTTTGRFFPHDDLGPAALGWLKPWWYATEAIAVTFDDGEGTRSVQYLRGEGRAARGTD